MARAAVLGRLTWRVATVVAVRDETATARTIGLDVPGWPGHRAGQHVDVRLTAQDGYSTERSYSIASAARAAPLELTVQRLADGEVSPYLTQVLAPGDPIEIRGPVGGWFVWDQASTAPVLMLAGGSGIVPLMAMIRTRAASAATAPFRLVYSVRSPETAMYGAELAQRDQPGSGLEVSYLYTRVAPAGSPVPVGRINAEVLAARGWPATDEPDVFVCGPTGFVEGAANLLVDAGHKPDRIKTERFGPTGGQQ
ncbi:MAG TPA: ferredoxin reductase [Streptosporangiaceae bacterium]|jgi:ferredoxin-NADP reductase|nr:ferredoxin reductase [Streptosporangiaceae bacterium]